MPIGQIIARINSIEAKIARLSAATDPANSIAPSFGAALQKASAPIDPDGQPVRPLSVAGYTPLIEQSASKYGIDPNVVSAVMKVESDGDPNAVSHSGAMGLMQLMPSNVKEAGITNPFDPAENIDAGTHQLASAMGEFDGNLDLALAAYNAGPNAVKRYGGVPPYHETQQYIQKIHSILDQEADH